MAKPGLSWQQAAELIADGWEMGAHTATHPRLAEVYATVGDDAGVVAEIESSHAMYREGAGCGAGTLCLSERFAQCPDGCFACAVLPFPAALALHLPAAVDVHRPQHVTAGVGVPECG